MRGILPNGAATVLLATLAAQSYRWDYNPLFPMLQAISFDIAAARSGLHGVVL
jgi:hypothetical protein